MPIDLKWIRNNPDHVRAWQRQRGLSEECVDTLLAKDNLCRNLLKVCDNKRAELKRLQQAMRPSSKGDTISISIHRDDILHQRKTLEEEIRRAELEWKAASTETRQALWCIASPIDDQVVPTNNSGFRNNMIKKKKQKYPKFDFSSNVGLDLSQAYLAMARRAFKSYPIHKCPEMVSVGDKECSVKADLAHAMCGCKKPLPSGCDICAGVTTRPAWVGLVAHRFPGKSIFGTKQLPQYVGIWTTTTTTTSEANAPDGFQVVAMSAGTVWDSRTVQSQLLEELKIFYQDLLCSSDTAAITTRAVPANELELHELSRILLTLNDGATVLGWVSNFGDSASRSNDVVFLGGGNKNKKNFVHFIQATVLTPDSIASILNENIKNGDHGDDSVSVPKSLLPFLLSTETSSKGTSTDEGHFIPLKALLLSSKQNNDQQQLFHKKAKPGTTTTTTTKLIKDTAKSGKSAQHAVVLDVTMRPTKERMNLEALSCPFEFLFPQ